MGFYLELCVAKIYFVSFTILLNYLAQLTVNIERKTSFLPGNIEMSLDRSCVH